MDGPVDDCLKIVWVGIGVPRFDLLHGAIEDGPADGIFDEFREDDYVTKPMWETLSADRI
jgi:hypothetical protein